MAQLQQRVEIAWPLEEVFALVANPGIDARWSWDLVEVGQVTPGPLGWGQVAPTRLAEPPLLRAAQRSLRSDLVSLKRLRKDQRQD